MNVTVPAAKLDDGANYNVSPLPQELGEYNMVHVDSADENTKVSYVQKIRIGRQLAKEREAQQELLRVAKANPNLKID